MSVIPFKEPPKRGVVKGTIASDSKKDIETLKKTSINSFCLINNKKFYGSMTIKDGIITFSLVNLFQPIFVNDNESISQVFTGILKDIDPEFPMIYDKGKPSKFFLDNKDEFDMTMGDVYDAEEKHQIGNIVIGTESDDLLNRVEITIFGLRPHDLDSFSWGIDHVYVDCKDCPVSNCQSRGMLPMKDNEGK